MHTVVCASVCAASSDGHVKFWKKQAQGIEFVKHFKAHLGAVTGLAVSHDGNCLLAACMDSALRLLDRAEGQLLAEYRGHTHTSFKMDCDFSAGGGYVVGSSGA